MDSFGYRKVGTCASYNRLLADRTLFILYYTNPLLRKLSKYVMVQFGTLIMYIIIYNKDTYVYSNMTPDIGANNVSRLFFLARIHNSLQLLES